MRGGSPGTVQPWSAGLAPVVAGVAGLSLSLLHAVDGSFLGLPGPHADPSVHEATHLCHLFPASHAPCTP